MKKMKKLTAILCAALMLTSMLAIGAFSASAYSGGGQAGTSGIKAYGCDLSYYNVGSSALDYSKVDFAKMYADGCRFVILRIGYEGSSSHTDVMDSAFVQYYKNARSQAPNMKLGVYFYSLATTKAGAQQDAQWVINKIAANGMHFEYPIYYDVEDSNQVKLGSTAMTNLCLGWCETMEANGYFSGVYGGKTQVIDKLGSSFTSKYDVWYARVLTDGHGSQYDPRKYDYSYMCGMWQYAWYDCNFAGVKLDFMDANVTYKDYATIIESQGLNNCGLVVSFDSNGGSPVPSQAVQQGGYAKKPADPTKPGYNFAGWYDENGWEFKFETTPIWASRKLTAHWTKKSGGVDFMPKENATTVDPYPGGSSYVWPVFGSTVTMYKGGDEYGWPSMTSTYPYNINLNQNKYLHISTEGDAFFNGDLCYQNDKGESFEVKFSEIYGNGGTDFAPGSNNVYLDLAAYLTGAGNMPADGILVVSAMRFYVVGSLDQYVTISQCQMSGAPTVKNTMLPETIAHEVLTVDGAYDYNCGVFTVSGNKDYQASFSPNLVFRPAEEQQWLFDITATAKFDVTMVLTTSNGDQTVTLADDFFDRLGYDTHPTSGLNAGTYKTALNLYSFYTWAKVLPADGNSTIKKVIVRLWSNGAVTMKANQISSASTIKYFTDSVHVSGSTVGATELTSDVYTIDQTLCRISDVPGNTTIAKAAGLILGSSQMKVYEGDTEVSGDTLLKTGDIIKLFKNGAVIKTYTVIVNGDVDADGLMTSRDSRYIVTAAAMGDQMSEPQKIAADYDRDGSITTLDARLLIVDIVAES